MMIVFLTKSFNKPLVNYFDLFIYKMNILIYLLIEKVKQKRQNEL